jgi:hypothetical protein
MKNKARQFTTIEEIEEFASACDSGGSPVDFNNILENLHDNFGDEQEEIIEGFNQAIEMIFADVSA